MGKRKRIVTVTGATGFVGRRVIESLRAKADIEIRCLVRNPQEASRSGLGDDLTFFQGDITQPNTLREAFRGAWGVINVAGYREFWSADRAQFYDINERGARNVFEACLDAKVSKVVQVSTPLAWGVPDQIPFNEDTSPGEHPSDYARSKFRGDSEGWRLYRERKLPLTTVYLAAVIGAGDDKATMEVRRAVDGQLPALVGADTTYTYLYVGDAAEAIVKALVSKDSVGQKYLIGNQRATTRDYFKTIGRIADVPIPDRNIPERWLMPIARGMELLSRKTGRRPVLPVDVLKTTAAGSLLFDSSRSIEELGMAYTPLETALTESIEAL